MEGFRSLFFAVVGMQMTSTVPRRREILVTKLTPHDILQYPLVISIEYIHL